MVCEFELCLYNEDNSCTLESTDINSLGMCDACIIVSLDENFLKAEKKHQLQKLNARWEK